MHYENDSVYDESDPRRHTQYIRRVMMDLAQHALEDMEKVKDPRAQSLFERTAAALQEMDEAYGRFERDLNQDGATAPVHAHANGSAGQAEPPEGF